MLSPASFTLELPAGNSKLKAVSWQASYTQTMSSSWIGARPLSFSLGFRLESPQSRFKEPSDVQITASSALPWKMEPLYAPISQSLTSSVSSHSTQRAL